MGDFALGRTYCTKLFLEVDNRVLMIYLLSSYEAHITSLGMHNTIHKLHTSNHLLYVLLTISLIIYIKKLLMNRKLSTVPNGMWKAKGEFYYGCVCWKCNLLQECTTIYCFVFHNSSLMNPLFQTLLI